MWRYFAWFRLKICYCSWPPKGVVSFSATNHIYTPPLPKNLRTVPDSVVYVFGVLVGFRSLSKLTRLPFLCIRHTTGCIKRIRNVRSSFSVPWCPRYSRSDVHFGDLARPSKHYIHTKFRGNLNSCLGHYIIGDRPLCGPDFGHFYRFLVQTSFPSKEYYYLPRVETEKGGVISLPLLLARSTWKHGKNKLTKIWAPEGVVATQFSCWTLEDLQRSSSNREHMSNGML